MQLSVTLQNIIHIHQAHVDFDLTGSNLICVAGKNGSGKTTLIKAIRNITNADTFKKTSPDGIFSAESSISYKLDGKGITFQYDSTFQSLNCKEEIPDFLKSGIAVELPIPHGERFNFFQKISHADSDIRKSRILGQYSTPTELIAFLVDIYESDKFNELVEINLRDSKYYCILLPEDRYLREDYLSSGEYFLISLYRRIVGKYKTIVIDEIDISLDPAAQVRLVNKLKYFSAKYGVKFIFTTHSLALMRTLAPDELFYMDLDPTTKIATITNISYNTSGLMQRNSREKFLSAPENVISILDGDQRDFRHGKKKNTHCIPLESVEKAFLESILAGNLDQHIKVNEVLHDTDALRAYLDEKNMGNNPKGEGNYSQAAKKIFTHMISEKIMTKRQIFEHLCEVHQGEIEEFSKKLQEFLTI